MNYYGASLMVFEKVGKGSRGRKKELESREGPKRETVMVSARSVLRKKEL